MDNNNWMVTRAELDDTPSVRDGYAVGKERANRRRTTRFMHHVMEGLKVVPSVKSTACLYFHRFFMCQSMKEHDRNIVGASCIFLACKYEESFRHLNVIVNNYFYVLNMDLPHENRKVPESDPKWVDVREKILISERIVLQTLAFDLEVSHAGLPFGKKWTTIKNHIEKTNLDHFGKTAKRHMFDCYRSMVPLLFTPVEIAMGAFYLASVELGEAPTPSFSTRALFSSSDLTWLELVENDITEERLCDVCNSMIDEYESPDNFYDRNLREKLMRRLEEDRERLAKAVRPSPSYIAEASPSAPTSYDDLYNEEPQERSRSVTVTRVTSHQSEVLVATTGKGPLQQPVVPGSSPYYPAPPPPPDSPWSDSSAPPPPPDTPSSTISTPAHCRLYSETPDHEIPPPPPPPESPTSDNGFDDPTQQVLLKKQRSS